MRCKHCQNIMDQTDQVVERHTCQTWYRCPVCHSQHTVSEPSEGWRYCRGTSAQRSADAMRYRRVGTGSLNTA